MFDPGPSEELFVVPEISPQTIARDHLNLLYFFARRRCNGIGLEPDEFVSALYLAICKNFKWFDPSRYSLATWVGYMARQVARQAMRESGRDRAVPFGSLPATDDGTAFDPADPTPTTRTWPTSPTKWRGSTGNWRPFRETKPPP